MRRYVAVVVVAAAALGLVAVPMLSAATPDPVALRAQRVLVVTLPSVSWEDVIAVQPPALLRVVAEGSTAALAARTATSFPSVTQGFLSLGAGNRAFASRADESVHVAYQADATVEGVDALQMLTARVGEHREGAIVHPGVPRLQAAQERLWHGAVLGSLGEALAERGVSRAVVAAADVAARPGTSQMRRSAVLAMADHGGVVDHGRLDGLVRPEPGAPFSVVTDPDAFSDAVADALAVARVVLAEPGETLRADEFAPFSTQSKATEARREALLRSDAILASLLELLTSEDLLLVVSPVGSTQAPDRLTLVAARGAGVPPGMLTSATTRLPGLATLTDVGPTILAAVGGDRAEVMTGRPMFVRPGGGPDRIREHHDLDRASVFREPFLATAMYVYVLLIALVGVLAFLAFLQWTNRNRRLLVASCYVVLALPVATYLVQPAGIWRLHLPAAQLVLWGTAGAIALVAGFVPGPRWAGGVAILGATALVIVAELMSGGGGLVNAIFGNSVMAAGRFYGLSNPGFAVLFGSGVLGLTGAVELLRSPRPVLWMLPVLAGLVAVMGLPRFGADFGGLIAGGLAAGVALLLAAGKVRWSTVAGVAGGVLVVAAAVLAWDLLRPVQEQTHLGRFAASLVSGGFPGVDTVVRRKALQSLGSFTINRWTWTAAIGVAVLALLLHRPGGVLRSVLGRHHVMRAGLWAVLVGGVAGFAVNDSGVVIPAMLIALAVPLLVLMASDAAFPRRAAKRET